MILLIDNYDSFTYNLVQRFGELDPALPMTVVRNDQITPDQIAAAEADAHHHLARSVHAERGGRLQRGAEAVRPDDARSSASAWDTSASATSFGGEVIRNWRIMHGKVSPIHHDGKGVFAGLSNPFEATRYHSLVIKKETWTQPGLRGQRLDRGGRDHGRAAQALAAARRAVPPGELSDRRRAEDPAELSGAGAVAVTGASSVGIIPPEMLCRFGNVVWFRKCGAVPEMLCHFGNVPTVLRGVARRGRRVVTGAEVRNYRRH